MKLLKFNFICSVNSFRKTSQTQTEIRELILNTDDF